MRPAAFVCLALAATVTAVRAEDPPARVDALGDPLPPGCVARLGTDRMRTTGHPSSGAILWSPDGKRVAVAQPLGAARVWDAATGRLVRHFDGPFDYCSAAFTPDGKSVLVGERRGVVWKLNVGTGEAAVLFDARYGRPRPKGPYFESPPLAHVSPDGKLIYVAAQDVKDGKDGKVGSWEARDAEVPAEVAARVPTPAGGLWIAPRPDHKYWVFADGQNITRVEKATGNAAPVQVENAVDPKTKKPLRLYPVTLSPDGRSLLVMVGYDRTVLYDLHDGKVTADRKGPVAPASRAVFTPDGKELIAPTLPRAKHLFSVIDPATLEESRTIPGELRAWADHPAVSPDGKTLAVTDGYRLRLFDLATGEEKLADLGAGHVTKVQSVQVGANGLVVTADMKAAHVWDPKTGKTLRTLAPAGVLYDLHLSPDGKWAGFPKAGGIDLVDTATGKERVSIPGPTQGRFVGFSDVGNLWFSQCVLGRKVGEKAGPVSVFEIEPVSATEVQSQVVSQKSSLFHVTVSADGKVVVIPGLNELSVWRRETGAVGRPSPGVVRPRSGTYHDFNHQAISADGRVYVTNRENFESVEVWLTDPLLRAGHATVADPPPEAGVVGAMMVGVDALPRVRTLLPDPPLPEPGRPRPTRLSSLVISPDGRMVIVGCTDGSVRGLEAVSLNQRFRVKVAGGPVTALTFTPDGSRLVVGGEDTVVSVWDVAALAPVGPPPAGDPWAALSDPDPSRAAAAVGKLASDGEKTVALLKGKAPVKPDRTFAQLVADLGDPDFPTRERGEDGLVKLGPAVIPALQGEFIKSESAEVRARIESAIKRIRAFPFGPAGLTAEQIRAVRAVQVLERIGSKGAAGVLAEWAKDHPGTLMGAEAKAAAARLARLK